MNLVFCMAGLYARFRREGYALPKYLLPVAPRTTLLEAIVGPFAAARCFDRVLFVLNERDVAQRGAVEAIVERLLDVPYAVAAIADTRGQAETALIATALLRSRLQPATSRVVFHNVDTILRNRDFPRIDALLDTHAGVIDVFDADSPSYSYVGLDAAGTVVDIAEKVVLSRHATTGLYAFASWHAFETAYRRCAFDGEAYVSQVYKQMLRDGARLALLPSARREDTQILGTPAEYEAYLRANAFEPTALLKGAS
jgi:hypothetical protein